MNQEHDVLTMIKALPSIRFPKRFDDKTQQLREDEFVAGWNYCLEEILKNLKQNSIPTISIMPNNSSAFSIKIEGSDGIIRDCPINQFHCTGLAPDLSDIKSGKISREELGTIGYFRHPNGHLCSSSLYSKYKDL